MEVTRAGGPGKLDQHRFTRRGVVRQNGQRKCEGRVRCAGGRALQLDTSHAGAQSARAVAALRHGPIDPHKNCAGVVGCIRCEVGPRLDRRSEVGGKRWWPATRA
eukprot:3104852-Prymnesium_polylepis.1